MASRVDSPWKLVDEGMKLSDLQMLLNNLAQNWAENIQAGMHNNILAWRSIDNLYAYMHYYIIYITHIHLLLNSKLGP